MGTQEVPTRRAVSLGDVTAVLELARSHRDTTAIAPASWDAVIVQIRAVVVEQAAGSLPVGAAPRFPAPGGRTERH